MPTCPAMERRPHRHFVAALLLTACAACGPIIIFDTGDDGGHVDDPSGGPTTGYGGSESGGSTGGDPGTTGGSTGHLDTTGGMGESSSGAGESTGEPHCEPVWDPTYSGATCTCDGTVAPPEACRCELDPVTMECWCGVNLYPKDTCRGSLPARPMM